MKFSAFRKYLRAAAALFLCLALTAEFVPVGVHGGNELTGLSAFEIVSRMGIGFNLGNTFDATGGNRSDIYSQEQSWGNPIVSEELIKGIRKAGFTTIRIPITWYKHISKDGQYTIMPEWLDRIRTVVDYALDADLYVIINLHHEEWINRSDLVAARDDVGEELKAVWAQIADYFADYDQRLIFEGMNEPRAAGTSYEWNGTPEAIEVVNYLDEIFVETIRANGKGHNPERALMIPGYAASSGVSVLSSIRIPETNDSPDSNIIISTHCYSPYNFCLSDTQSDFNLENSGDTSEIKTLFKNLKRLFLDNGIPVIIGECGCTNTEDNFAARARWLGFFHDMSVEYGIPAILWDNGYDGNSGGECHNYFVRKTGEPKYPDLVTSFVSGPIPEPLTDTIIDFEPRKDGGSTILVTAVSAGFTSSKLSSSRNVNHTATDMKGLSLKVDSATDYRAVLDISKYSGLTLRVSAWLLADAKALTGTTSPTATVSFLSGGTAPGTGSKTVDSVSVPVNADNWSYISFDIELTEDISALEFSTQDTAFYIDDIGIKLDDGTGFGSTFGTKTSIAGAAAETPSDNPVETPSPTAADSGNPVETKTGNPIPLPVVLGVIAVILVAIILIYRKKHIK